MQQIDFEYGSDRASCSLVYAGEHALTLSVPGGASLAMAGTTEVTVRSTHRRRGILRSMIERHLEILSDA